MYNLNNCCIFAKNKINMDKLVARIKNENYSICDNNTGEIIEGVYRQKCSNLEDFIMLFFKANPVLMQLDGNALKILLCCWELALYDKNDKVNVIYNNRTTRDKIRKCANKDFSDQVINKAFCALSKRNILIKIQNGEYRLNPKYSYKGSLTDRAKLLLEIEYKPTENKNFDNNEEN